MVLGLLAHPLQRRTPAKSKMADVVWKGVYPWVIRHPTFAKYFFFYLRTSITKVDNIEDDTGKKKIIKMEIVITKVVASQPPDRQTAATPPLLPVYKFAVLGAIFALHRTLVGTP